MKKVKKILQFLVIQLFVIIMSVLIGIEIAKLFGNPDIGKMSSFLLLFLLTWVIVLNQFFEDKDKKHE